MPLAVGEQNFAGFTAMRDYLKSGVRFLCPQPRRIRRGHHPDDEVCPCLRGLRPQLRNPQLTGPRSIWPCTLTSLLPFANCDFAEIMVPQTFEHGHGRPADLVKRATSPVHKYRGSLSTETRSRIARRNAADSIRIATRKSRTIGLVTSNAAASHVPASSPRGRYARADPGDLGAGKRTRSVSAPRAAASSSPRA